MDNSLKSVDFIKNLNSNGVLLIFGFVALISFNRKSFLSKTVFTVLKWIRIFVEDLCLTYLSSLWILIICGFPQSACMIYRWFVWIYVKLKFGSQATTIHNLDVVGIVEDDDAPVAILSLKVLDGVCDLDDLRARILATVTKKNNRGQLKFAKFQQTLKSFSGYACWIPSQLDINYHVRILDSLDPEELRSDCSSVSESRVLELISPLAKCRFEPRRSPWEVLVVPKFHYDCDSPTKVIDRFAIIIRVHHAIGDGYSFLKLIIRDTSLEGDDNANCPTPATPKTSSMALWKGILVFLYLTLRGTRALLAETFVVDDNPLFRRKPSGKTVLAWSPPMSLDFLKELKDSSGVGLTTVFLAALTSSVRKYIYEEFNVEPSSLSAVIPFPAPNHPNNKITNKFSFVRFPLPCSEASADQVKHLKAMEIQSRKLATAPDGPMNLLLLHMVGVFPTRLIRGFLRNKQSTLVISNLPGPSQKISIWGKPLAETMFWLSPLGVSGISAAFLSYNSQFRLGLTVDTGIITDGRVGATRLIQGFLDSILATAHSLGVSPERAFRQVIMMDKLTSQGKVQPTPAKFPGNENPKSETESETCGHFSLDSSETVSGERNDDGHADNELTSNEIRPETQNCHTRFPKRSNTMTRSPPTLTNYSSSNRFKIA